MLVTNEIPDTLLFDTICLDFFLWHFFYDHLGAMLFIRSKWLPVNLSVREGILVIRKSSPPSMPISSGTGK